MKRNQNSLHPKAGKTRSRESSGTRYFVSRHLGAIAWAQRHHWGVGAVYVPHLDAEIIQPGDTVIGTLPIHLAAAVCARGAHYLHLALDLTAGQRGSELGPDELDAANARLIAYRIEQG